MAAVSVRVHSSDGTRGVEGLKEGYGMSREEYIKGIIKILNTEPDSWVIKELYRFVVNMTKGGVA